MAKEIICVFQDCPMCGDKGKKLKKFILDKKLNVRKVSFASPEGKELCYQAVMNNGIKTMPFFTDGNKFTATLEEFIAKPKKTSTKKKKAKKEVNDESA